MDVNYSLLNVSPSASLTEIKKAYRQQSLLYHPDRPGGNQLQFQKISDAYTQICHERQQQQQQQQSPSSLFTSALARATVDVLFKPEPIDAHISVLLSSVFSETATNVFITRRVGLNRTETENMYVHIHQGADTGEVVILPGRGHISENGTAGDVRVYVGVENDMPAFERRGLDLFFKMTISLKDALCGKNFIIPHRGRNTEIRLSNERSVIYPGQVFQLPGWGIPRNEVVGKLFIEFHVQFPSTISDKLKECLREELEVDKETE